MPFSNMNGLLAFLIVFVPILLVFLRLYGQDRRRIAVVMLEQASTFARNAKLFVPSESRIIVPRIETILGGEHCLLIDGATSACIGKTHHRLFNWFSSADQSLHCGDIAIHIETQVQLNPYGILVTLRNGELIEGEGRLTPEPDGSVGGDHRMWRSEINWRGNSITFEPKIVDGIPKGHDIYVCGNPVGSALRMFDRIDPRVLLVHAPLPDLTALVVFYISSYGLGDVRSGD